MKLLSLPFPNTHYSLVTAHTDNYLLPRLHVKMLPIARSNAIKHFQ